MTEHEATTGPVLLFIYGTLKRGHRCAPMLAEQRFLETARTAPIYRLLNCGTYPGLVRAGTADGVAIEGELWEVDRAGLAMLDAYEGLGEGLYQRVVVDIEGPPRRVEGYLYARDTVSLEDCGNCWSPEFESSHLAPPR